MSRKMPTSDFRAVRTLLEASDFAHAPGPPVRPLKDLVDKESWQNIQTLPETVAIFTSNDHGADLRLVVHLWGEWVSFLPLQRSAIHRASLVTTDELQASIFNSLHGFYRVAADTLRSVIEQMTIATYCELGGDAEKTKAWLGGTESLAFGKACDSLQSLYSKGPLRRIFQQDDGKNEAGWTRRLHSALSEYSHGRPGFDAAHMWEGSNGPIYVKSAFLWNLKMWLFTYATCVLLLKLVRADTPMIGNIFEQRFVSEINILRKASQVLWSAAEKRPGPSREGVPSKRFISSPVREGWVPEAKE